jgi:transitional endoplasmic reticulum ATPase
MSNFVSDPYIAWQKYLMKHSQEQVLKKLEYLIQGTDDGLFKNDPSSLEFRKLSLLFRIDLLIEWGRYAEALAWLCLETEINPSNYTALALKEQLKGKLSFKKNDDTVEVSLENEKLELFDWSGVAGMRKLKATLERDILLPMREPETYRKYKLKLPHGLLLYGPPGCGKNKIVGKLAKLLGFNSYEIGPSFVGSPFVHGTQIKIKELFEKAAKKAPALLFIDEFESFVPNRNSVDFHYQSEVNEFLHQLNTAFGKKIFVVAATNNIRLIDPSVIRPGRFDKKIFVGPPDIEARSEAFRMYLQNRPHQLKNMDFLLEETEYYTFAEIENIVSEAARKALSKNEPINLNHLMVAVQENPPFLNQNKIAEYMM